MAIQQFDYGPRYDRMRRRPDVIDAEFVDITQPDNKQKMITSDARSDAGCPSTSPSSDQDVPPK